MKPSRTRSLRLIFNLFIFLGTLYAFYLMYCRSEGNLQARGFEAFKYFTVQSNVFGGVMAAVWLTFAAAGRKRGKDIPRAVHLLKFAAAVSLGLTFLTVMVFLGRIYGYIPLLRGANLWFHLLVPLAAMAECVLFNREKISMKKAAALRLVRLPAVGLGRGRVHLRRDLRGDVRYRRGAQTDESCFTEKNKGIKISPRGGLGYVCTCLRDALRGFCLAGEGL